MGSVQPTSGTAGYRSRPVARHLAGRRATGGEPRVDRHATGRDRREELLATGVGRPLRALPLRLTAGVLVPLRTFAAPDAASQIAYAASRVRAVGGNAVRNTFTDADAVRGLLADFDRAKRKIQFETFLFSGEHGEAIADKLIARHREGIAVQVLLDGKGQSYDGYRLANKLKAAGVDVRFYDTSRLNKPLIAVDHAKLAMIDDAIAWIGGANFDHEISRDMMTRIEGPGARQVEHVFNEGWRDSGGRVLSPGGRIGRRGDVRIAVSQVGPREATARGVILRELLRLGKGDELELWMMDLGDHQLISELESAHRRGARLHILLDPDVPFLEGNWLDRIRIKFLAGAPDLYAISRLQAAGIEVRYFRKPQGITKLHGKVWLFVKKAGTPRERLRVVGGSVNAILGALDINREAAVLFYGKTAGRDVRMAIEHDLAHNSVRVARVGSTFSERLRVQLIRIFTKYLV